MKMVAVNSLPSETVEAKQPQLSAGAKVEAGHHIHCRAITLSLSQSLAVTQESV